MRSARWNQPLATAALAAELEVVVADPQRHPRRAAAVAVAAVAPGRRARAPRGRAPRRRATTPPTTGPPSAAADSLERQGGVERGARLLPGAAGERLAPRVEVVRRRGHATSLRRVGSRLGGAAVEPGQQLGVHVGARGLELGQAPRSRSAISKTRPTVTPWSGRSTMATCRRPAACPASRRRGRRPGRPAATNLRGKSGSPIRAPSFAHGTRGPGDLELDRADAPALADARAGDVDAGQREVLAERAGLERAADSLLPPRGVLAAYA